MKGFTLIEVLVTCLIFSLIIGGIYGVMNLTKINYDTNLVSLNLQRQARQGMNLLSREIRQASWASINIEPPDPEVPGDLSHSIRFNTPEENDVNYSVQFSEQTALWQLKRNTDKVIANDIRELNLYQDLPKKLLNITMLASKTFFLFGKERIVTFSLTQQVEVRNP